eukprot:1464857-Rhodomonas_salina.6
MCTCLWHKSNALPCRHILTVLKYDQALEIPDELVSQFWFAGNHPTGETLSVDSGPAYVYNTATADVEQVSDVACIPTRTEERAILLKTEVDHLVHLGKLTLSGTAFVLKSVLALLSKLHVRHVDLSKAKKKRSGTGAPGVPDTLMRLFPLMCVNGQVKNAKGKESRGVSKKKATRKKKQSDGVSSKLV